jgi:hypothetical protein
MNFNPADAVLDNLRARAAVAAELLTSVQGVLSPGDTFVTPRSILPPGDLPLGNSRAPIE